MHGQVLRTALLLSSVKGTSARTEKAFFSASTCWSFTNGEPDTPEHLRDAVLLGCLQHASIMCKSQKVLNQNMSTSSS